MDKRHERAAARDGDAEARILDAAQTVFLRRGTAGARMQEIADQAGVNKALLHYYFRSKSDLAAAVFARVAEGLLPLIGILASDTEFEAKVRQVIVFELEAFSRVPFAAAYVMSELNQRPERARQFLDAIGGADLQQRRNAAVQVLALQLKARVRAGIIRRITIEEFMINLISLCMFPFLARPLLAVRLDLDDRGFQRFIDRQKKRLPVFFLNALRP
jgi:TetR/AcrR family transcriptional regulator